MYSRLPGPYLCTVQSVVVTHPVEHPFKWDYEFSLSPEPSEVMGYFPAETMPLECSAIAL